MNDIYIGINSYDENKENFFVGRTEETWQLYERIVRNDYTVYYAASGEGKSSLIKAGLLPILRRRGYFPIYIVFNEEEFSADANIGDIIEKRIEETISCNHTIDRRQKVEKKENDNFFSKEVKEALDKNEWWKIRNVHIKKIGEDEELVPLFIFDQFEEVFTKTTFDWTEKFFKWLEIISFDGIPAELLKAVGNCNDRSKIPTHKNFKALFSFRTEYLGELDYWCAQKHFLPLLQDNRLCLKQMTLKGAKEVVSLNPEFNSYSADIIKGCVDERAGENFENTTPCVHALILSVVCQTLCGCEKEKVERILSNLKKDQKATVNEILLIFYREKLKQAGLDVAKDEKVIADIEDALIDENGKRKRLKINITQDDYLTNCIEKLYDSENGLIKVVAQESITKTIELPHDRLCLAIDSERKIRQERNKERLIRQEEWMQFGIVSFIVFILAYLWNLLNQIAAPAIAYFIMSKRNAFGNLFKWLLEGKNIEYKNQILRNEPFAILTFMFVTLFFILPLSLLWIKEKKKAKPSWFMMAISVIETCLLVGLLYRSRNVTFENDIEKGILVVTFVLSLIFAGYLVIKRIINRNIHSGLQKKEKISLWPFLMGVFILGLYAFHETLYNTNIGLNEPKNSCWAPAILTLLALFGSLRFCKLTFYDTRIKWISYCFTTIPLCILSVVNFLPHDSKHSFGMPVSVIMLVIIICTITLMSVCAKRQNGDRKVLVKERISFGCFNVCVLLIVWFLSLGYNPFRIASDKIVHVYTWRTVVVRDNTSGKYGVLLPNGESVIPFVKVENDSILRKAPFKNGYFYIVSDAVKAETDITIYNSDSSFCKDKHGAKGKLLVIPTLEEYLASTIRKGLNKQCSLDDSISYYAACAFKEIRDRNVHYIMTGRKFDEHNIKSFNMLDSLQSISMMREIEWLSDSVNILNKNSKYKRSRIKSLHDEMLSNVYREVSKCMLLCVMRDRLKKKDIFNIYSLQTTMGYVYFYHIPQFTFSMNATINGVDPPFSLSLYSEDFNNNKLFALYELFSYLCYLDMQFHNDEVNKNRKLTFDNVLLDMKNEVDSLKNGKEKLDSMINTNDGILAARQYLEYLSQYEHLKKKNMLYVKKSQSEIIDYATMDPAFLKVYAAIQTFVEILKSEDRGIYNNAIEKSCIDFFMAAKYRNYNVQKEGDILDTLKKKHYNDFDVVFGK